MNAPALKIQDRTRLLAHLVEWVSALRPLWRPVAAMVLLLWISRFGLAAWQWERVTDAGAWRSLLLEGIRFDGVLLGLFWLLPATLTPWMTLHARSRAFWPGLLRTWGLMGLLALAFMELATPAFVLQYGSRPNYLFVEYLGYAKEVGGTLVRDFWPHLLVTALLLPTMLWAYQRFTRRPAPLRALNVRQAALLSVLAFLILALCARGALGHRPANPATAALTSDHLVNELPLSSLYTVLYAVHLSRKGDEGGITYGHLPPQQVIESVRRETGLPASRFTDPERPLSHLHEARHARQRPLNLIIVLEESLGAEFVGRLGGLPLTPNLDRLASEGIWFDRLYATGTRSVRGIEAVVAGYPPTSAVSTVKLARSQRDFFTIASFLKDKGYQSTFFYGGESHFDNMRSFFMGNGFDRVIEQKDMPPSAFVGTWGASDEDVFDRAHQHFMEQAAGQPFFGLIFTSSNHSPFEFPDGRITLHEQPKATVNNAVKYADHALGQFMARARQSPYWENTVFLIVADHNSRVYGPSLLPVERFHIPGLILGGAIPAGQRIGTVASQIDLAPTLFSLMGVSGSTPLIGRDLTDPQQQERPGRAIMQFDKIQAYMEGDDLVLLQPDLPPRPMRWVDGSLQAAHAAPDGLIDKALAHSQYAQMAYRDRLHR
jgi:phosphoglycerol transferase MdoB-like AlkP superfamily enzyme